MKHLGMELRSIDQEQRLIVGIAAPYDETSYLVPGGERIRQGAFNRSIQHRSDKVPLLVGHDAAKVMGYSQAFSETAEGLQATFRVNDGATGDQVLDEVRNGYLPSMSVGFMPTRNGVSRADDGIAEVTEAKLVEVSLVGVPAYEGAAVLAVRSAERLDSIIAPFEMPKWDLDPLPPTRYSPRRHR